MTNKTESLKNAINRIWQSKKQNKPDDIKYRDNKPWLTVSLDYINKGGFNFTEQELNYAFCELVSENFIEVNHSSPYWYVSLISEQNVKNEEDKKEKFRITIEQAKAITKKSPGLSIKPTINMLGKYDEECPYTFVNGHTVDDFSDNVDPEKLLGIWFKSDEDGCFRRMKINFSGYRNFLEWEKNRHALADELF